MRTVDEVVDLAAAAAGLWVHAFTRMGCWFLAGFSISLLANYVSVLLGGRSGVAATVVFVLGLVGLVAALVLTIDAPLRGPDTAESRLDVLARTVGPFLAVYAVWGLVEDEVSELFVINIALQGLGGYETWSVNLSRVWLYVGLAVAAWVVRRLLGLLASRVRPRVLLLPSVLAEGVWVVASLLALLTLVRQGLDWLQGRAVWQWWRTAWQQVLAALPDLRLPFDLTLPEAVAAAATWFWTVLLPGLSSGVLLPLLWLALTATVLGWPDPRADLLQQRTEQAQARLDRADRTPAARLALGAGRLLTADLRTKYLPVLRALGFVLAAGWRFVLAYLILATAVTTARGWSAIGARASDRAAAADRHPGLVGAEQSGRGPGFHHPIGRGRMSPPTPGTHRRNSTATWSASSSSRSRTRSAASAGIVKATPTAYGWFGDTG